ncbi:hypothetical protein MPTK1_5g18850 [Marchantia polymorpha subsp. ruderalis]|uniref:Uncharacterized protein n=2 Tax=Marchantia polymorpha TaxID=3197 RepID=A0AAF6BJV9_MARPO|nr:hypothetical protein MARPO_0073s0057 [Marchantia polymorpha]BBN12293.1 hypothetical protein Mp_5g18850 [Marchantia polymorpha subsp. ruderalis]|eukprot:PTQ35183.1 hypothetical protein MARPO_0073s0057 [Marchantia polymorpha]
MSAYHQLRPHCQAQTMGRAGQAGAGRATAVKQSAADKCNLSNCKPWLRSGQGPERHPIWHVNDNFPKAASKRTGPNVHFLATQSWTSCTKCCACACVRLMNIPHIS